MGANCFDLRDLPRFDTPYFLVDESKLKSNLRLLRAVAAESGCKILLAQKAFSMFALYPLIGEYLDGTAASGLYEARLGHEHMGGETHVFSAAYRPDEMDELLGICGHVVFNSLSQWELYRSKASVSGAKCGLRINPQFSTQNHAIYDPCAPFSRLGIPVGGFPQELPGGITGLHFHTLCEQGSDALIATLGSVEAHFGRHLEKCEWVNFGGGHHITRDGYDVESLVKCVSSFRDRYGAEVYLEPGEAVALDSGYLVSSVLDVVRNGMDIAILDASAACHMPDVLEMPYRPNVIGASLVGDAPFAYRLAGSTCLAGDIVGDYAFREPLRAGDLLAFEDMAIYSMVKTNTFNGMRLPSIAVLGEDGNARMVKGFSYEDFKARLS